MFHKIVSNKDVFIETILLPKESVKGIKSKQEIFFRKKLDVDFFEKDVQEQLNALSEERREFVHDYYSKVRRLKEAQNRAEKRLKLVKTLNFLTSLVEESPIKEDEAEEVAKALKKLNAQIKPQLKQLDLKKEEK